MLIDTAQLDAIVAAADLAAGNSPATDAALAATLSTPIVTPRPGFITFATLCAVDVWGFAKATAALAALSASTDPQAKAVVSLLNGSGFNPNDPQASALAAGIVALTAGAITADDATLALNTKTFPAGDVVQASDVTASRARIALAKAKDAAMAAIESWASYARNAVDNAASVDALPVVPSVPTPQRGS